MDIKQFITEARKRGQKDEDILMYLKNNNLVDDNNNPVETSDKKGLLNKASVKQVGEFALGAVKAAGRSAIGLANIIPPVAVTGKLLGRPLLSAIPTPEVLQPKTPAEKYGGYAETALELAGPMAVGVIKSGPALIKNATNIYLKALKPSVTLPMAERVALAKTGLKEGLAVSEQGVEKMVETISNLESKIGNAISNAKGSKITTDLLKPFVNEAKRFLGEVVDVKESKKAIKEIDNIFSSFKKRYGNSVDIELAQKLKTNTYKWLQNYYEKLSSPTVEASKQLARGLKEEILKKAPEVGDINKRLTNLYSFEEILNKAASRVQNANIISLGSKVLSTKNGGGGILAAANELFGPVGKSYFSIVENKLGNILTKLTPEEVGVIKKLIDAGRVAEVGLVGKTANVIGGQDTTK